MLKKFFRARGGNILPIFAIALIPMLVATGGVVDYTNAYDQRGLVQDAMDAAALAAGKQVGLKTTAEVEAEAQAFFAANVGTGKVTIVPPLNVSIAGTTVDATTELHVPTYFLGIIGLNEFVFQLKTQVTVAMGTLEVAMALDNSGSMAGSRIVTLRQAAVNLANTLHGLAATSSKPDPIKIALAPFAASVNVGPGNANAAWMDTGANGTYHANAQECYAAGGSPNSSGTCTGAGTITPLNNFTLFNSLKYSNGSPVTWGGCVEERPMPYDVSDDAPSTAVSPTAEERKTLFVPMFAADDPDPWTCTSTNSSNSAYCPNSGSSNSTRRWNGAPSGTRSYNNYLPDSGDAETCWSADTFTVTSATPALFTRNSHGFSLDTELQFYTSGSLYTGLSTETSYFVSSIPNANTFRVSTMARSDGPTFTVTAASPAVVTRSSHGLTAGTVITLSTTGSLLTGLSTTADYWVAPGTTSSTFRLASVAPASSTISIATPAVVTQSSHGLSAGSPVTFSSTGSLPTGITAGDVYYVATSGLAAGSFRLSPTASNPTFTTTIANPAVFTSNAHGFSAGTPIAFTTTGSLPTGLTAGTVYYVTSFGLSSNNFRVSSQSTNPTFTVSGNTFTSNGHGLTANTPIVFASTGTMPGNLSASTVYYVLSSNLTTNTFRVSTSVGGSAVSTSSGGSGTRTWTRLVATSGSQSGTHRVEEVIVTSGSQSGTHSLWKLVTTSGSQSGTHRYQPYVNTSGSQSGTHRFTRVAQWTCQSGSTNCNGTGDGRSFEQAFGGRNVTGRNDCKYGTPANKATISSITVGGIPGGPNFMCTTTAVTPLTTSQADIVSAINAQEAIGATNITAGLMWGWRLLSPGEPFTEGREYSDSENQKIIILMSDGANTYYPHSGSNQSITKSWYGAWGYVAMGHLDGSTSTSQSTLVGIMNQRTALACTNAKAAGIRIYTIAFDIDDAATLSMMETCASEPTMAFQSNNEAELLAAFNAIGDDISLLRIAQ